MKTILSSLVIVFLCLQYSTASNEVNMPEKQWEEYKLKHNKNYAAEEDAERFAIFKKNLAMIEEHNAKYARGETTYTMGLNHMTDWTDAERNRLHGSRFERPAQQ